MTSSNGLDVVSILMEHLDPIVDLISHQDVVIRINKEMPGIAKLPSTNHPNKITLGIKDLQPVATPLSHHNIPIRQNTNTNGTPELTVSPSL